MFTRKSFLILLVLLFSISGLNAEVKPLEEIISIDVSDVNGTTEIKIDGSGPFKYTIYKQADPYQVIVELQDISLGTFEDKIVVDRDGVLEITPVADAGSPNAAKLEIALTVPADVDPIYNNNSLILAFDNPEASIAENDTAVTGKDEEAVSAEELAGPAAAEYDPFENRYVGEKISIDFQDADLNHVFRLLADISGYNIVVSPDVKGKFSMKLTDVPWDQALDIILRNYTLSKTIEGNIIRVAPTSVLAKEEEEIAKAKESQEKAGNLLTMVYPINYAAVEDIKKAIDTAKILTKRGFISVDDRTSSVIIKDVEKKHVEYENLIRALDQPTPQVSIEAKIVEVTTDFQKELGVQWGTSVTSGSGKFKMGGGNIPGGKTGLGLSSNPLMVNLPATSVSPGKGGAIALGFLDGAGKVSLDIQLSAMESSGKGKVVSNPRITTSDNQEAVIMQGKKIPYQTISDSGTQTEFIDALLELKVTPHITPEGTVVMDLEAKKNEADFAGPQVLGVPTIDIKEVKTQVLIRDGDTLVIGGIFKTNIAKNRDKVPGFANIPILGSLFKFKKNVDNKNELLIFITPRIVKPASRL